MSTVETGSQGYGIIASDGYAACLHPLVLLNISDQATRGRTHSSTTTHIGGLIGTCDRQKVDFHNSFELLQAESNPGVSTILPRLNSQFFFSRREQYKDVFPNFEFLGLYVTIPGACGPRCKTPDEELALHIAMKDLVAQIVSLGQVDVQFL